MAVLHRSPLSRAAHSRRGPRYRRRARRRWPVLAPLAVVAVLAAALAARVATEAVPAVTASPLLPAAVRVPGSAPAPAWPAAGEAAVDVPGLYQAASVGQAPQPIASLAKVMTAYLVLQDHPLPPGSAGWTTTVGAADVADLASRRAQGEAVVGVHAGEQLDEEQLLEGLLVPSGSNLADLLAAHDAGTAAAFVARMNATARALGMTATTYTDPAGADDATTSTAADQTRLAARAMAIPAFARIVAMPSVALPGTGTLAGFDTALGTDGIDGIKTGSDARAGGCLMFAATREIGTATVPVVGTVLGQGTGAVRTATLTRAATAAATALIDSVLGAIRQVVLVPAGTPALRLRGAAGSTVARTSTPLGAVALPGTVLPLRLSPVHLGTSVAARAVVASATLGSARSPIVAGGALAAPGLGWRIRHAA